MKLTFPDNFIFGTSTASAQIETAFEHDWQGVKARNGTLFERTTDHEKRFKEDAAIIASVAPNYRMGLMWSKLQRAPFATFDLQAAQEYHLFIQDLKSKKIGIMMVLHHFTNPLWFSMKASSSLALTLFSRVESTLPLRQASFGESTLFMKLRKLKLRL